MLRRIDLAPSSIVERVLLIENRGWFIISTYSLTALIVDENLTDENIVFVLQYIFTLSVDLLVSPVIIVDTIVDDNLC